MKPLNLRQKAMTMPARLIDMPSKRADGSFRYQL